MIELAQAFWDQMRAELRVVAFPQLDQACHSLRGGCVGPLTPRQAEDLEAIERSVAKLAQRVDGEPINWNNSSEAAHALRGPLNSTIGFSSLLLNGTDGPVNETQREALETVLNVSRRLLALFNLLLDMLLLASDGISLEIECVRVDEILEELIATGQALANNRGFVFEADVAPRVAQASIKSDPQRLKQALSALLAVSAKYVNDGVVTLRAEFSENELLIRLENRMCQLPVSLFTDLSHLFEEAADRSLPYDAHLRLGLAWHILTRMKGSLEAQRTGEMCTFTVTLPMS
jgi:signal transduction histidine kinase